MLVNGIENRKGFSFHYTITGCMLRVLFLRAIVKKKSAKLITCDANHVSFAFCSHHYRAARLLHQ